MQQRRLPEIGEIWTNVHSKVDGVVARLDGTIVVLASLTGMRAPCQFARNDNPWAFKSKVPEWAQQCARIGCQGPAFLQYERSEPERIEVVCPLHLPKGVQAAITTGVHVNYFFEGRRCNLGHDATEVLNEIPVGSRGTMWNCQDCAKWWIHQEWSEVELQANPRHPDYTAVPSGYKQLDTVRTEDLLRRVVFFDIMLRPGMSTRLTGPKPLTFFDHVRRDFDV